MLYVTTRSDTDHYTANRALMDMRAPDGGLYLPMQIPCWSPEQTQDMKNHTFFENFAQILHCFFSLHFSDSVVQIGFGINPTPMVSV